MASSGKFVLRVEPELHARLTQEADKVSLSLNEFCKRALEGAVGHLGSGSPLVAEARRILKGMPLLGVVLFGSQARGEALASSDTDLLLVMDSSVRLSPLLYRRWDEVAETPTLSPHFVHLPTSVDELGSLWLEVALEGRVLFDTDRRVARFLADIRGQISSGRYVRKMTHGHPYWIRG